MPNELVNLEVHFISLVEAGANRRQIIWKWADPSPEWSREVPIRKTDEEKRLVYGIVYAPDEVDAQGDFATAAEIEKAAHGFMRNLRLHQVDRDHSFQPEWGAFVAESWLVRAPDPLFPQEPEGSWAIAIKVEDDDLWEAVKAGKYRALSLAGQAERINVRKDRAPEDAPWRFRAADYTVEQLARACAWVRGVADPHEGNLPEDLTKDDCKLPHHTPEGKVVLRGVMAAGNALQGARGGVDLPASDRARVKRHLEAHYHEFGRQAPWEAAKADTLFEKFRKWWAGEAAKEEMEMTKEEITRMVQEALTPLAERLEALEKKEPPEVEAVVKEAVAAALKPLQERLEVLEKASPGSRQDHEPINPEDEARLVTDILKFARQA